MGRTRVEWSKDSACIGAPEEVFFPERGRPSKNPPYLKFCGSCPVAQECLEWAVVHQAEGIWGGTTERERKTIQNQMGTFLKQKASHEGWLEPDLVQWLAESPVKSLPDQPLQTTDSVFHFDFEVQATDLSFDEQLSSPVEPPVELLVAAQHSQTVNPTVPLRAYASSIEFRFDFELL